jgi:hypothetical protein
MMIYQNLDSRQGFLDCPLEVVKYAKKDWVWTSVMERGDLGYVMDSSWDQLI